MTSNCRTIKVSYTGKEDQKLDNILICYFDGLGFKKSTESYDFLDKEKKLIFDAKRFTAA